MSKRNPKKRIVKKLLKKQKRLLVPNGRPVDVSKERNFKCINPNHYIGTLEDAKRLGLDEEELIIFP